jgi:hypothetical protein
MSTLYLYNNYFTETHNAKPKLLIYPTPARSCKPNLTLHINEIKLELCNSGVTLYQGAPGSKVSKAPYSRSAKCMSRAPYMHKFSSGSRACSSGKFLNLNSLKCHYLDFGERFYRILMVRKRHCNISEALANVFALSPKPAWGPPLGLGAPGFSRSEPIVVTPLLCNYTELLAFGH